MKKILLLMLLAGLLMAAGGYGALIKLSENYPKSEEKFNYAPILWNYSVINNSEFIDIPSNYQDYIMPDNPIIQYYAKKMRLDSARYGIVFADGSPLKISYQDQNKSNDFWQNPDYTLTVAKGGDCEDLALVVASILEAKGINTTIIMGFVYVNGTPYGHAWVEYYENNTYFINSNLYSFKRKSENENLIDYYYSPEMTDINSFDQNKLTVFPPIKYQPRYIFGKHLQKIPYLKNWRILV